MFGGQQIRAYKTIMKSPGRLPRRPETDVRLFRFIAWGAFVIIAAATVAIVGMKIADIEFLSEPVFLAVIPMALVLLFCWWLLDVAPVIGRWLIASLGILASIGCLVLAWFSAFLEQVQLVVLILYLATISRLAWQQIRQVVDENDHSDKV